MVQDEPPCGCTALPKNSTFQLTGCFPSFCTLPKPPPKGTVQTLPLGAFQLAVMIGDVVTYHPFFKLRVMKYWSSIWLTDGRLPEPATDQTLFTRLTIVHLPGCTNNTADCPTLNLPCPWAWSVTLGTASAAPMPHISLPR